MTIEQQTALNTPRLLAAAGLQADDLTPAELRSLQWLAGWEKQTVDSFCGILQKAVQQAAQH